MDTVFVVWVIFLIFKGLSRKENWFGWFMFSRARYFQATLHDRNGEVDVWEYLPHCQVMLSERQLEALLRHINGQRCGGYILGTVTMYHNNGPREYMVRRNLLIPKT